MKTPGMAVHSPTCTVPQFHTLVLTAVQASKRAGRQQHVGRQLKLDSAAAARIVAHGVGGHSSFKSFKIKSPRHKGGSTPQRHNFSKKRLALVVETATRMVASKKAASDCRRSQCIIAIQITITSFFVRVENNATHSKSSLRSRHGSFGTLCVSVLYM